MKPASTLLLAGAIALTAGFALRQAGRTADESRAVDAARVRLARLEAEHARQQRATAPRAAPPPLAPAGLPPESVSREVNAREIEMRSWYERLAALRESFARHPGERIPELTLLTDLEWLTLARYSEALDSPHALRKAWSTARSQATAKAISLLAGALRDYLKSSNHILPADVSLLQPFLKGPLDPAALARYEMRASGPAPRGGEVIAERAPIDEDYDFRHGVSVSGARSSNPWSSLFLKTALEDAQRAYSVAHAGRRPAAQDDLLPFVNQQEARTIFTAMLTYRAKNHGQEPPDIGALRPLISDPATLARLEKMTAAEALRQGGR